MPSLDMDDEEESNASSTTTDNILNGMNGGTTSGRSVSNTVHDRSRLMSTSAPQLAEGRQPPSGDINKFQSTRNSASSTSSHHHHHTTTAPEATMGVGFLPLLRQRLPPKNLSRTTSPARTGLGLWQVRTLRVCRVRCTAICES